METPSMPLATSSTDTATVRGVWRKPVSTAQSRKGNKKVNDRQENAERISSKKCLLSEQERGRLATALKQAVEQLQQRQQQPGPAFESLVHSHERG
jgi:hypothetical protein